jgi:hypothetical protein
MGPVSLFQALWLVVPWQMRRPVTRDVTLLQDAEFQILLRELRYPPIRLLDGTSVRSAASTDSDNDGRR